MTTHTQLRPIPKMQLIFRASDVWAVTLCISNIT